MDKDTMRRVHAQIDQLTAMIADILRDAGAHASMAMLAMTKQVAEGTLSPAALDDDDVRRMALLANLGGCVAFAALGDKIAAESESE